jgi:Uma2 family endonuclease
MDFAEKKDHYTYADYLTWDTDERYELIDGVPHLMSFAPQEKPIRILTRMHQMILVELTRQFANYLHYKSCNVYITPIDVRLNPEGDDDTVVQPDLVVVCDESKEDDHGIVGAPDLVIEILSPSTASYDMGIKHDMYREAGVTEYWIVDPDEQSVRVYFRKENTDFSISKYGRGDSVPVGVLDGFQIDLKDVFK